MALDETHVFLNVFNGVTILQKDGCGNESIVALAGDQVELVMLELQRLLDKNKFTLEMPEEE